ncbi:hypothetical protein [Pseudoduganella albidiflava]|uniref:Uncharacterized protein n=1 Tax=Pseudoduganella albidiflava TaxID=321983 RepID=A0A411WTR9_9BURK|nr:hypothetical protein [Pseudoduganella albidiflava]QBI00166.1 hypothetical protein EYF70_04365 [Pseudoduganella albidiflava]GGY66334.1 hypothetical protein GCM10007387_55750 [Pseudoduganella albidiflava]
MNWYKKDTRPSLLIAHADEEGLAFAQLLHHALPSNDYAISLMPASGAAAFRPAHEQRVICSDVRSTIDFAHIRGNVHVFAQSPYAAIEQGGMSQVEKQQLYLAVHNSLSKGRRVLALSEHCRMDVQQFHSMHVFLAHLPSTYSDVVSSLDMDGVAIIVNDDELAMWTGVLEKLDQFSPTVYLNSRSEQTPVSAIGMRMPHSGFIPTRPAVQIYLGKDRSYCTPLRIIDASATGSAVVQVTYDGLLRGNGRLMPADCIGYFSLDRQVADPSELMAFVAHLLSNRMFHDSILTAQRRYLPNFQSNRADFFELLTK